jgi:hypothetical protein
VDSEVDLVVEIRERQVRHWVAERQVRQRPLQIAQIYCVPFSRM